jgi:CRP-like cAMP-binding protein
LTPELKSLLQEMPIFGGISEDALVFLLERVLIRHIHTGQCLFHEGDDATSMFVLERGRVAIRKRWGEEEHLLKYLEQGECFGEMALLDMHPRSASVSAVEDCILIELSRGILLELYEHDLEQFTLIQMNIGREISRRLRLADNQLFSARFGRLSEEISGNDEGR